MPPLDPRRDFRDDGGTPAWRARTIDVYRPGLRHWYRTASPLQLFLGAFLGCLFIGGVVPILALLAMYALSRL